MVSRLGDLKGVEIEVVSKPRAEYQCEHHRLSGLPSAPAVMINEEVVVQGKKIGEQRLRELIAIQQSV
jgi:hypothetical protein